MSIPVKQSTAQSIFIWMADSTDGKTGKTGLTLAVTLAKYGDTSFSSISPTVTEVGSGHYKVDLTTTHMNTVGLASLRATATGADPADLPDFLDVVGYDKTDAVRMGLTALPNAAAEAAGGLYTRGTGAGQINQDANGRIDANTKAWIGGTIPAVNVTGVPLTDQKYSLGTILATPTVAGIPKAEASGGSIASVSGAVGSVTGAVGSVTGSVGSVAANGIAATSLATGAITNAKFAAGAIDAAAIANAAIDAATYSTDALALFSSGGGGGGGGSGGTAIWTKNEPTATKRRVGITITNDSKAPAPRGTDFMALGLVYVQGVNSPNADVALGTMTNVRRALAITAFTFTVNTGTSTSNLLATAHGLQTGDGPIRLTTTGALPTGLAAATDYYVILVDANTFKLASSLANAYAGTAVTFSTNGSGTNQVTSAGTPPTTARGVDGYFVYQATQAETNHSAAQTGVIVEGTGYARANGGGGYAAAAMDPGDTGWDGILEGSVTRDMGLRALVRGEVAKKTLSGATITTRDIADTKNSHHGDVTAAGGRISAVVDDLT